MFKILKVGLKEKGRKGKREKGKRKREERREKRQTHCNNGGIHL
jgi:hypothetical protein